jgi:hypothetical protein
VKRDGAQVARRRPVEMGLVRREVEGREGRRAGAEVARRQYNVSFVCSVLLRGGNIGGKMVVKMGGEGWRIGGNDPARWPLSA